MNIKLHVIGTGYVGLVSGVMMSYLGHDVTCLDSDISKIDQLKKNILPIYEPKLAEYLPPLVKSGKLRFTASYSDELQNSQAVFITVGTPSLPSGKADLQYIFTAIDNLCPWIKDDCLIIIKSTVPPTTCNQIIDYLNNKNFKFSVASNPEFLREGTAIEDFLNPDRILIGTNNKQAEDLLKEIYRPLITKNIPMISTDLVTAELTKYVSNAFLATKIAFINEMANLCEKMGANTKDLSCGVGLDKRIGKEFLNVGPGFGGSCFPKDMLALGQIAKHYQCNFQIVNSVINSNYQRPYDMVDKIHHIIGNDLHIVNSGEFGARSDGAMPISNRRATRDNVPNFSSIDYNRPLAKLAYAEEFEGDAERRTAAYSSVREDSSTASTYKLPAEVEFCKRSNKVISVLGLTFKAGTDDVRESPAIKIVKILVDKGANIRAFDPVGMNNAKKEVKNVFFADSALSACKNSDIIIVATEWSEFKDLDWSLIRHQVKSPIILDLRHILDGDMLKALGFKYYLIGIKDAV
ncbi:MAG: nucleotide sugar dehydrogenase [Rickettsia endosymbiont of Labidopullus appendiculatus]|nr:nucleotide sugar dehydrogenase [Rickettsia endosymbiont of Labidopullus appendiculatus]